MKKILVFVTIIFFTFTLSYSQIKVNSSGKVGINNLNPSFNLECNGTSFFNAVPAYDWGIHIESAGFMGGAAIYPDGPSSLGLTNKYWYDGYITNLHTGSDARFKTNVSTMDNVLLNIMKVRSVNYDLSNYFFQKSFNNSSSKNFHHTKNRKGFVAQELQLVFPELVKYDSINDIYCVNYLEFIPITIAGIQEQQVRIDELESELEDLKNLVANLNNSNLKRLVLSGDMDREVTVKCQLYQNSPNPFGETTSIRYSLPEGTTDADIIIYDMTGKQLQRIPLTQDGKSSIEVNGGELDPGMYMYTMIKDDTIIDTKQMIIIK